MRLESTKRIIVFPAITHCSVSRVHLPRENSSCQLPFSERVSSLKDSRTPSPSVTIKEVCYSNLETNRLGQVVTRKTIAAIFVIYLHLRLYKFIYVEKIARYLLTRWKRMERRIICFLHLDRRCLWNFIVS